MMIVTRNLPKTMTPHSFQLNLQIVTIIWAMLLRKLTKLNIQRSLYFALGLTRPKTKNEKDRHNVVFSKVLAS